MNMSVLGQAMEDLHGYNPLKENTMKDKPNLGLATTRQLIDELAARAQVADVTNESWPNYKTVGGESDRGAFGMPTVGRALREMDGPNYEADDEACCGSPEDAASPGYKIGFQLRNVPQSEQAYRIAHNLTPIILEHFIQRNAEYGESSHVLGVRGQYADINRKVIKLKRYLWDGVPVPDGGESEETIAIELVGHLMILLDELMRTRPMDGEG